MILYSPKFNELKEIILIELYSVKEYKKATNVPFILDIDKETKKVIGIEIINLAEHLQAKTNPLRSFQSFLDGIYWDISYDADEDIAYIGFSKKTSSTVTNKQVKGSILLDSEGNVAGLEIDKIRSEELRMPVPRTP